MRRSWLTYMIIGGSVALLAVLGALQYTWQSRISETEGEKAQARVNDRANRFAEDFNREMQNTYFNFQAEAEAWKQKDWSVFNERYEYWKSKTLYPELISAIYFFPSDADAPMLKYLPAEGKFVEAEDAELLSQLRAKASDPKAFEPFDSGTLTMFLPIHEAPKRDENVRVRVERVPMPTKQMGFTTPPRFGVLAITLDPETLRRGPFADLAEKHFGDGEFRIAVTDKEGNPVFQSLPGGTADASVPLFNLAPENVLLFSRRDLMSSISPERSPGAMIDSRVESRTFSRVAPTGESNGNLTIELSGDGQNRTKIFTATTAAGARPEPWILAAQHNAGSVDAYVASTFRRDLAVALGVLLLLAVAVAAIVISSVRARMLAQRQIDFVSSVSHEFRTPLAVIYSAGENLADGVTKDTAQVERYGDLIKSEGKKLTGMVEQILDFAGANSGKRKYTFTETRIDDVVNTAIDDCRPMIEEKGISVETDVSEGLPILRADRAALSQAIQNLIANAVKYSNGSGWLRITATNGTNGDDRIRIAVEDRGIGISKSELKQIFEPFYRSKQVVDAQIHGNGLGLSLVKRIVEAHGGKVTATSEIGKGSMFTIEIRSEPPA